MSVIDPIVGPNAPPTATATATANLNAPPLIDSHPGCCGVERLNQLREDALRKIVRHGTHAYDQREVDKLLFKGAPNRSVSEEEDVCWGNKEYPYMLIACSILSRCWLRCPICDEATIILAFLSYALQVEADRITKSQGSYPFIGRPLPTHAEGDNKVDQRMVHNEDRMVIENEADEAKGSPRQGGSHHGDQCVAKSDTDARMSEVMPSSARRQTIHSPNDHEAHPLHPLGPPPPTAPIHSAALAHVEVCDLTSPDPIESNERHPLAVRPASCKVEGDSGFLFDGDQHPLERMAEPDSSRPSGSVPLNDVIEYLTQLPPLESAAAAANDRMHREMMPPHTDGRHGVNIDQRMVSRPASSHQEHAATSNNGSNQYEKRPKRPTQRSNRIDDASALKKSPFGPYRLRVTLTSPGDAVEPLNEYDPSDCEWRQVGRRTYTASER